MENAWKESPEIWHADVSLHGGLIFLIVEHILTWWNAANIVFTTIILTRIGRNKCYHSMMSKAWNPDYVFSLPSFHIDSYY